MPCASVNRGGSSVLVAVSHQTKDCAQQDNRFLTNLHVHSVIVIVILVAVTLERLNVQILNSVLSANRLQVSLPHGCLLAVTVAGGGPRGRISGGIAANKSGKE